MWNVVSPTLPNCFFQRPTIFNFESKSEKIVSVNLSKIFSLKRSFGHVKSNFGNLAQLFFSKANIFHCSPTILSFAGKKDLRNGLNSTTVTVIVMIQVV